MKISARDIMCWIALFVFFSVLGGKPALEDIRRLDQQGLVYSDEFPIDSVIMQTRHIMKELSTDNDSELDLYFDLYRMQVCAYATRGDMELAANQAKQMQLFAQEKNNLRGMAQACRAIADAYRMGGMVADAEEPYNEAIRMFEAIKGTESIRQSIIYQLFHISLLTSKEDKVLEYLQELKQISSAQNSLTELMSKIYIAYYHIQKGNLDEASLLLNEIHKHPDWNTSTEKAVLYYDVKARYEFAIGNFQEALHCLDQIFLNYNPKLDYYERVLFLSDMANLYLKIEEPARAARCYEEIWTQMDSLRGLSYGRQVNLMRTSFQVGKLDLENRIRENEILLFFIFFVVVLISGGISLFFYIRRKNRLLQLAKENQARMKKRAEDAICAKNTFLSNMSHEIRTPINAIVGFSELLIGEDYDADSKRQFGDIIRVNSELLLKLINDIVDLSYLDMNEMEFRINSYDAVKLCKDVIDTIRNIKQTNAEIRFQTESFQLQIETDPMRLQQLLINLLVNATKFTASGEILLQINNKTPDLIEFSVTDTGCGIPSEKQKDLFKRFGKLNNTAQGFGLGLSICQRIIHHLGGEIWLDASYTKGSRFVFTHPVKQQEII